MPKLFTAMLVILALKNERRWHRVFACPTVLTGEGAASKRLQTTFPIGKNRTNAANL